MAIPIASSAPRGGEAADAHESSRKRIPPVTRGCGRGGQPPPGPSDTRNLTGSGHGRNRLPRVVPRSLVSLCALGRCPVASKGEQNRWRTAPSSPEARKFLRFRGALWTAVQTASSSPSSSEFMRDSFVVLPPGRPRGLGLKGPMSDRKASTILATDILTDSHLPRSARRPSPLERASSWPARMSTAPKAKNARSQASWLAPDRTWWICRMW